MIGREALRYVLAGGVNTAVGYLLYLLMLPALGYRAAYVVAFVLGIGLSYLLLRHAVFARPGKRFSLAYVTASHMMQLALGLAVVEMAVNWMRVPAWLAPLMAVAVCVPVMFVIQRWIFTLNEPR